LNAPPKVSANWFGEKERIYSTAAGFCATLLGCAFGYLMSSLFITEEDYSSTDLSKHAIRRMMIWTAIIGTTLMVAVFFTFTDKPANPPALSEVNKRVEQ
jgi:cell division protein FtsW (lipid II flippase)